MTWAHRGPLWLGLASSLAVLPAQSAGSETITAPRGAVVAADRQVPEVAAPEAPSGPPTPANLAQGRPVSLLGAVGDPTVVTDGRLAPEGAISPGASVALPDVRSAVLIDLGGPRNLAALLVQAGAADVYFFEISADASSWSAVWQLAPLHGALGLRTRTTVLPRPIPARWLRIRATTPGSAAVSEVQAFATAPTAWPPLDTSLPESALPLWPSLRRETITTVYHALAVLLMLVAGWSLLARRYAPSPTEERVRRGALVTLGALSLLAWPNLLNFHYYGVLHKWEFFHYYMGGKYLPELGYSNLYLCAATVDAEEGFDLSGLMMRDLRDNRLVPAATELRRSAECHARFSARRWEQFRHDARFFRGAMGKQEWESVRYDHGFNGTPAWAVLSGLLARLAPASQAQLALLALLDLVLLLAVFAMIGRTFGLESAAFAAGWFGVNALAPFGWTGGGFLRYDWLFWLVAGLAALRKERPAFAGFALSCATLLRVFPACALAGVALKALAGAIAGRTLRPLRDRWHFLAGAAAAAIVCLAGSSLLIGRAQIWREFAANTAKHLTTESTNYVGLRVFLSHEHGSRLELMRDPLLPDPHERWAAHRSMVQRNMRVAHWVAGAAFVLLLTLAVRDAPDWVAAVLGLGLLPVALTLSSYYYSALIAYATLWALSPAAGFALTVLAWITNLVPGILSSRDDQYAWLSLAVLCFTTGVAGAFAWRGRLRSASVGPAQAARGVGSDEGPATASGLRTPASG